MFLLSYRSKYKRNLWILQFPRSSKYRLLKSQNCKHGHVPIKSGQKLENCLIIRVIPVAQLTSDLKMTGFDLRVSSKPSSQVDTSDTDDGMKVEDLDT
ncbi:hypothetical protein STEG23_023358 [Scotinomys teguina]